MKLDKQIQEINNLPEKLQLEMRRKLSMVAKGSKKQKQDLKKPNQPMTDQPQS